MLYKCSHMIVQSDPLSDSLIRFGRFLAFIPYSRLRIWREWLISSQGESNSTLPNTFPQAHFLIRSFIQPWYFFSVVTSFLKPFNRLCYKPLPSRQARLLSSQPPLANRRIIIFFFWSKLASKLSILESRKISFIFQLVMNETTLNQKL